MIEDEYLARKYCERKGKKLSPKQQAVLDRICLTQPQEGSAL
jgi:hypothetical protein